MTEPSDRVTVRAARSSRVARRPSSSSTDCCSYQAGSLTGTEPDRPSRNSLDSGGRSYGTVSSALTSVMSPSKPSLRSSATAAALATPPPTPTIRGLRGVLLTGACSPGADIHVNGAVLANLAAEPRQLRVVGVDPAPG